MLKHGATEDAKKKRGHQLYDGRDNLPSAACYIQYLVISRRAGWVGWQSLACNRCRKHDIGFNGIALDKWLMMCRCSATYILYHAGWWHNCYIHLVLRVIIFPLRHVDEVVLCHLSPRPTQLTMDNTNTSCKRTLSSPEDRYTIDPAAERKLLWKLDLTICPVLFILYLLSFLDRSNIGNAKIQGMTDELQLDADHRYNIALMVGSTSKYILKYTD